MTQDEKLDTILSELKALSVRIGWIDQDIAEIKSTLLEQKEIPEPPGPRVMGHNLPG